MQKPHLPFSVIIPTYNREQLVLRAIESVRKQSYSDYELIVVDDASTDGTCRAISELEFENLRLVELSTNSGVSAARNAGVERASGRYVVFLDSDDEMLPGLLAAYDKHVSKWPDVELFWAGLERLYEDESGRVVKRDVSLVPANSFQAGQANRMYAIKIGSNRGLALRRESFLKIGGFDENFRYEDDREFLIRTLKSGLQYVAVNEVLVCTHRHQSHSLTGIESIEKLSAQVRARERVIEKHRDFLLQAENQPLLRRYSERLINYAYKAGDTELARRYVMRVLQNRPWHLKLLTRAIRNELRSMFRSILGRKTRE